MKKDIIWSEPELVTLNAYAQDVAIGKCEGGTDPSSSNPNCTNGAAVAGVFDCGAGTDPIGACMGGGGVGGGA